MNFDPLAYNNTGWLLCKAAEMYFQFLQPAEKQDNIRNSSSFNQHTGTDEILNLPEGQIAETGSKFELK